LATKYTKIDHKVYQNWPKNIPNRQKTAQLAEKYRPWPKYIQIVVFG
jgi:hypothetical protein